MPEDWSQWLTKRSNETETAITMNKVEPISLHTDWGCGISLQLLFQTRSESLPIPVTSKAFFKASYADMSHYDAESHLREIKAFYLDRILKTNVVLPCIGYHLDRRQIQEDVENWDIIRENLHCIHQNQEESESSEDFGKATVEGSIMLWMYGLEEVDKERIMKSARLFNESNYGVKRREDDEEELVSAMNYAIFHYLGACMKSEHNHFSYRKTKRKDHSAVDDDSGRRYVAIDNDRCMTPKHIFSNREIVPNLHFNRIRLWQKLVFERICHVPLHRLPAMRVVQQAMDGASKSSLVSYRLRQALEDDVLSDELLKSEPEAFSEIDNRINKLGKHVQKHCPH
eukprot:CAMPEP_0197178550 /NCGR_PEP_ID=MMETSP1423-20130617/3796_1 /TAXON_ID=476441 /ORGANISM="Pseudo-nitzschia heimii, Strain UNC1101" /LENGTH=341 /DNA_ID=CAMNT_0042628319 /DNA_START=194 /DNA_END=1219 /DNA_ORIENTATION=+